MSGCSARNGCLDPLQHDHFTGLSMRATFHKLRVGNVETLTDDSAALTFEVPEHLREAYAFTPGESLTLRRRIEGRDERRTYSLCTPAGHPLRIGVRVVPDGLFSTWLVRQVKPGDVIEVQPPSRLFRLLDPTRRHLCIAAGSGITPMLSIAATALHEGGDVTMLYGNRTSATVMFAEELADLKNSYGERFNLIHALSREPRDVELFSESSRRRADRAADQRLRPDSGSRSRLGLRAAWSDRASPRDVAVAGC